MSALQEQLNALVGGDGVEPEIAATYLGCPSYPNDGEIYEPDNTAWAEIVEQGREKQDAHTPCWEDEADGRWVVGPNACLIKFPSFTDRVKADIQDKGLVIIKEGGVTRFDPYIDIDKNARRAECP